MKAAAKTGRHGHRNSTLILLTYRHGFRVSELIALRWDQVELDSGSLHVSRVKKGTPSVHPIRGPEIRALRRLKRDYPETQYVFVTERKGPLTDSAVRKVITRAGEVAKF
jgi:type 1 fimbriae regulatory protein FimB/type 1 fimbriae regulatory protein FimE